MHAAPDLKYLEDKYSVIEVHSAKFFNDKEKKISVIRQAYFYHV